MAGPKRGRCALCVFFALFLTLCANAFLSPWVNEPFGWRDSTTTTHHSQKTWIWVCFFSVLNIESRAGASTGLSEMDFGNIGWIMASFFLGFFFAQLRDSEAKTFAAKSSSTKGVLNTMLQQTHGAAVLYAITAAGFLEVLPLPHEIPISPADLMKRKQDFGNDGLVVDVKLLQQLLHLLASCEILEEMEAKSLSSNGDRINQKNPMFRHTKLSLELKATNGRAYAFVMVNFAPAQLRPWWRIQEAWDLTTTTVNPFFLEHGQDVFDYYSDPKNAEMSRNFNMLMQQLSISQDEKGSTVNSLVAGLPIFTRISNETISPTVVDVGGGVGHLLSSLLRVHPQCRGVLFDLPEVLNEVNIEKVSEKMSLVPGSFFEEIPKGDVFLLKWILHDWNDLKCCQILRKIREAMEASTLSEKRLLIIEQIVPEATDLSESAQFSRASLDDVYLWVLYGGRERGLSEYRKMLEEEGFLLEDVTLLDDFRLAAMQCRLRRKKIWGFQGFFEM